MRSRQVKGDARELGRGLVGRWINLLIAFLGEVEYRDEGRFVREQSPGFCADCPDHEACSTGYPCAVVRRVNAGGPT